MFGYRGLLRSTSFVIYHSQLSSKDQRAFASTSGSGEALDCRMSSKIFTVIAIAPAMAVSSSLKKLGGPSRRSNDERGRRLGRLTSLPQDAHISTVTVTGTWSEGRVQPRAARVTVMPVTRSASAGLVHT